MTDLASLWASLGMPAGTNGWQTIGVYPNSPCILRAGVRHPERREGVLVEVPASLIPLRTEYPQCRGFVVAPELIGTGPDATVRISLMRSEYGNPDIFATLAEDILVRVSSAASMEQAVRILFSSIKAWQAFMQIKSGDRLSEEEEIGLIGELFFLERALVPIMDLYVALATWQGPLNGLRDFQLRDHGIEVKTTDSPAKSTVRISSLDQLDESSLESLHLVFVKIAPSSGGVTLSGLISRVRELFKIESLDLLNTLDDILLRAGYVNVHADKYIRRFNFVSFDAFNVTDAFPRLKRSEIPGAIRDAVYDIDLACAAPYRAEFDMMLDIFMRN